MESKMRESSQETCYVCSVSVQHSTPQTTTSFFTSIPALASLTPHILGSSLTSPIVGYILSQYCSYWTALFLVCHLYNWCSTWIRPGTTTFHGIYLSYCTHCLTFAESINSNMPMTPGC